MSPSVVVIGSLNADLSVAVDRLPTPGETLLGGDVRRGRGGKGANQAVAASRAGGVHTAMIGAVGADETGQWLRDGLVADGIDVSCLEISDRPTGTALITLERGGENTIVVAPGANFDVTIDATAAAMIGRADVVLAQLEVPQVVLAQGARARRKGALFVLNAAPAAHLDAALASQVDLLVVNESEARLLGGNDEVEAALANLVRRFGAVVLTMGARGARYMARDASIDCPALRVQSVDAVGAGDTFCGVLAASLAANPDDVHAALRRATIAAGLAVTRPGAQDAIPTSAEVDAQERE